MAELITKLLGAIEAYGSLGVFWASVLEEIVAPLPSPLVAMGGGFLLLQDLSSWSQTLILALGRVALPVALGVTLGSLVIYALAFFGGKPLLLAWRRFLGVDWAEIEKMGQRFSRGMKDEFWLFFLRALPLVPNTAISVFWGLLRLPLRSFILFTFLGSLGRAFFLALLGWGAGEAYESYAGGLSRIQNLVWLLLALALILFFYLWRKKRSARRRQGFGGLR